MKAIDAINQLNALQPIWSENDSSDRLQIEEQTTITPEILLALDERLRTNAQLAIPDERDITTESIEPKFISVLQSTISQFSTFYLDEKVIDFEPLLVIEHKIKNLLKLLDVFQHLSNCKVYYIDALMDLKASVVFAGFADNGVVCASGLIARNPQKLLPLPTINPVIDEDENNLTISHHKYFTLSINHQGKFTGGIKFTWDDKTIFDSPGKKEISSTRTDEQISFNTRATGQKLLVSPFFNKFIVSDPEPEPNPNPEPQSLNLSDCEVIIVNTYASFNEWIYKNAAEGGQYYHTPTFDCKEFRNVLPVGGNDLNISASVYDYTYWWGYHREIIYKVNGARLVEERQYAHNPFFWNVGSTSWWFLSFNLEIKPK